MYPDELFWGIDLYGVFLAVGVVVALFLADYLATKSGFSIALQRVSIVAIVVAVGVGYASAVFFQALYNIKEEGKFVIDANTGATFLGGLIGGGASFLSIWFLAGKKFCKDGEEKKNFPVIANIAACVIPLAHGFGRLGCLMAGCCHGAETDAWYGLNMVDYYTAHGDKVWHKVVPVQLFEALFLFAFAALLFTAFFRSKAVREKRFPLLAVYLVGYGLWRFLIEYARADDRGQTFVSFLSPSQLVSVLMIVGGAVWLVVRLVRAKKKENVSSKN